MTDVFISFKNSYQGQPTRDREIAENLHKKLDEEGIKAFFSNSTLAEMGESEFKKAIDMALSEARVMIVIGTKMEYVDSKWVRYEWDTFSQEILNDRKPEGSKIFTYLEGVSVADLPIGLRNYQTFSTRDQIKNVVKHIKNSLGSNVKEIPKRELSEGVFAYYGIGQKIDYKKAFEILSNYEEDAIASYLLGQIHYYGDIANKAHDKTVAMCSKSTDKGYIPAGYRLAECYERGFGVKIDFKKHDEIKAKLAIRYDEQIRTINEPNRDCSNNLIYLGKTGKNNITKEAVLALEIYSVLKILNKEVRLFDVTADNEDKKKMANDIKSERNLFIFSAIKNINDSRIEPIWKSIFTDYDSSSKKLVTYMSNIQVREIPSQIKKAPYILRDGKNMQKIVDFFTEGG